MDKDLIDINKKIQNIKRSNGSFALQETAAKSHPFEQFLVWFNEALELENGYPNAMILATVDEHGFPDTRVVLLKELRDQQFIFYTNYQSHKAKQLEKNPVAALNFYWPDFSRQIRIRGRVEKIDHHTSDLYFATRPREAQLGAHASQQSSVLPNRETMDKKIEQLSEKFSDQPIPRPEYWGGYALSPIEYEFFQGRQWRMHDRLFYILKEGEWNISRLSP